MRCSLLLLSTYLDGELNQRRGAELDAHLIGCTRCQSGLGYLREESQRISGLARVSVPDYSAHALLAHVGLITAEDELPGNTPAPPPEHDDPEAPPWVSARRGKALPWTPPERHMSPPPPPPESAHASRLSAPVATLDKPHSLQAPVARAEHSPVDAAQLEVPGIAVASTERAVPAEEPATDDEPDDVPTYEIHEMAGPPRKAASGGIGDMSRRMRDAIGLRWALMRGGPMTDDDSIDLVTNAPASTPRIPVIERSQPKPKPKREGGRHQVKLHRSAGGAAGEGIRDRRLWIFAAGTLVLMVIGLLIGKHVETSQSVAQRPIASARATPAAPRASVAPAVPATPSPAVAAAPNPLQLTGAQTLGGGARGYAVQGLRYGAHPGDYRIVFDLGPVGSGSPSGTPGVTAGFGNPTTLYVIFAGVIPGGAPNPPAAGGVLTSVTLLPHSPIAGHIVYQLNLSRAVKLSAGYLTGPARLVLDLR